MDGRNLWNSPHHPVGAGTGSANRHIHCVETPLTPAWFAGLLFWSFTSNVLEGSPLGFRGAMYIQKSALQRDVVQRTNPEAMPACG